MRKIILILILVSVLAQPVLANDISYEPSRDAKGFYMIVLATAYTPFEEGMTSGTGLAYDGRPAVPYKTVAVDPKVIPLGSRLYIPEYGWMLAHDTGGLIKGNRIDLCLGEYGEMVQFGRRTMEIYVIPPEKTYAMAW